MLFSILAKIAVGATLGGVIGAIVTGDWIYTIVWAVGLPVFILAAMFGGRRSRRISGMQGFSVARVESVQRAGSNIDGSQLVDVRLTVVGDITYTTTSRGNFTDDDLRNIKPGSIVAVELVGANRPDARILTHPTEAVEAELAKTRLDPSAIPVASSVPAWETATTTTPGTAKPGTPSPSGAGGRRVLSIAIILVAAAVVLVPAYQSIQRGVNNIATGNWDGSDMVTGLYQQESVEQMIAAAGTSQFTNVGFYPEYILGDALSRTNDERTDSINWRYGRAWVDGPSFIQPDAEELRAELFDAAELDWAMVSKLANETVERVQIENPESVYAFVRGDDDAREPLITVYISSPYDDASVTFTFDGEVVSEYGSVFDE